MKTRKFAFVLFTLLAFNLNAQSDYASYLSKAMEKLDVGDCESAQKFYNVYKELSGESKPSVQVLIDDCKKDSYSVGEKIVKNGRAYVVAYTRDEGKHGLAVYEEGWAAISKEYTRNVGQKEVPTIEELKLIYANRDKLGLYNKYWSCTLSPRGADSPLYNARYYYAIDFSTGKQFDLQWQSENSVILLIHRF